MMRPRNKSASLLISPESSPLTEVKKLLDWYRACRRDLPWRRTTDPYAIWISESMLQQTQVQTVIPYFERWMQQLPTIRHLAALQEQDGLKLWEGLGYYNRLRNLIRAAKAVCDNHGGVIPDSYDALIKLPGIGPYTAGALCSIAFNQPQPILDGNVIRILSRIYGIQTPTQSTTTRTILQELATIWVQTAARSSDKKWRHCSDLNQAMMELGACVCSPKNPACDQCPVRSHCIACRDSLQSRIPATPPRTTARKRTLLVMLACREGRFLVRQRQGSRHNNGFWEFPEQELDSAFTAAEVEKAAEVFARKLGGRKTRRVATARHSITNNQFQILAFETELETYSPSKRAAKKSEQDVWRTPRELEELPFSSAHKKILRKLGYQAR